MRNCSTWPNSNWDNRYNIFLAIPCQSSKHRIVPIYRIHIFLTWSLWQSLQRYTSVISLFTLVSIPLNLHFRENQWHKICNYKQRNLKFDPNNYIIEFIALLSQFTISVFLTSISHNILNKGSFLLNRITNSSSTYQILCCYHGLTEIPLL